MSDQPIRVVVADDQSGFREALADLVAAHPRFELAGLAADTDEAIARCERERPDVALIDVKMPGGGGPAAVRGIGVRSPGTRVIVLSAYDDRPTVVDMLRAGAVAYLVKGVSPEEIADAIHAAAAGRSALSDAVTSEVVVELSDHLRADEAASEERRQRVERIRAVIDSEAIQPVFQPISDLTSGQVVGIESLSRFPDPDEAPLPWFDEARALGLGGEIELSAVERALERASGRLPDDVYLSLNLSPETILNVGVESVLRDEELCPRMVLEITEHAPIVDYERLAVAIEPFREAGGQLAIDDVGAGFASLRHILSLAPDLIKLDLTLTSRIDTDPSKRALATALISFAREIEAVIVAEGIETEAELETLGELGVPYGQGFYLARPEPTIPHRSDSALSRPR